MDLINEIKILENESSNLRLNDHKIENLLNKILDVYVNGRFDKSNSAKDYEFILNEMIISGETQPDVDNNIIIRIASRVKFTSTVKLLLSYPAVDPSTNDDQALHSACFFGYNSIVELLLNHPRVKAESCENAAIINASFNGHLSIVEMLLKHPTVDPSANNNKAFRFAKMYGFNKICDVLTTDLRFKQITEESVSDKNE